MKGVKVIGGSKQKDLVKSFEHLFSPNPNNVHLYIDKTYRLSKLYKKGNELLVKIAANLSTSKIAPIQRDSGDYDIYSNYRLFKKNLKQSMGGEHVNQISIAKCLQNNTLVVDYEKIQ